MGKIPPIPSELFTTFNDVTYFDEPHKYYVGEKQLTSVTTLIHRYEDEFDEDYWARYKADEYGIEPEDVKEAWRFINERATTLGSITHDYAENLYLNKVFPYPKDKVLAHFGYDPIYERFEITKSHVDKFYKHSKNKLIPIRTEFVVFCLQYFIGGMVDLLFYNVKAGEFQIWDWKTNSNPKAFEDSDQYMDGIFCELKNTDLNKYSIQLSTYKYIIEKYTGIKLGKSYLVWISPKNPSYEVIECIDYTSYVEEMFKDHKFKELNII
jgi:ATP-dependent exoDNAse (exonuclease V) beta subunit